MSTVKALSVRLQEEDWKALTRLSKEEDRSLNWLICQAVKLYLNTKKEDSK